MEVECSGGDCAGVGVYVLEEAGDGSVLDPDKIGGEGWASDGGVSLTGVVNNALKYIRMVREMNSKVVNSMMIVVVEEQRTFGGTE